MRYSPDRLAKSPRSSRKKPTVATARRLTIPVNNSGGGAAPSRQPFERAALIRPIFGTVDEYRAVCVALLYGLSIVVRYRPSIWRRVQEGDLDHMRVLIEAFLAVVERVLPEQFLEKITARRVFAKQPGSFFWLALPRRAKRQARSTAETANGTRNSSNRSRWRVSGPSRSFAARLSRTASTRRSIGSRGSTGPRA